MSEVDFIYQINNIEYIFCLLVTPENLSITIESSAETKYWQGYWESQELEEITIKAKSHKNFDIFSKMIISALNKESEIVKLDLLSYADLEKMKQAKANLNNSNTSFNSTTTVDPSRANTKFLIVKYITDFEHSQYPLRMAYVDKPDISLTSKTIKRLRKNKSPSIYNSEFESASKSEYDVLKSENINLKSKIKLIESHRQSGAVENDEYLRSISTIKDEYENHKSHSDNKIKVLSQTIDEMKNKISEQSQNHSQTYQIKEERLKNKVNELQSKTEKLSELLLNERSHGKKYIDDQNNDFVNMVKELQHVKENEKKLKVKIVQLEKELDLTHKQVQLATLGTTRNKSKQTTPKSNYSGSNYNYSNKSGSVQSGATGKYTGKYSNISGKVVSNYSGKSSLYSGKQSNYSVGKYSNSNFSKNSKYSFSIKKPFNPFDNKLDVKGLNTKKFMEYRVKGSPSFSSKKTTDNRSYSNSSKKNNSEINNNTNRNVNKTTSGYTGSSSGYGQKKSPSVGRNIKVKPAPSFNNTRNVNAGAKKITAQQYTSSNRNTNIKNTPSNNIAKINNTPNNNNNNNQNSGQTQILKATDMESRLDKVQQLLNNIKK